MSNALIEAVKRYTDEQAGKGSPFITAIDGMAILRADYEKPASHLIMKPALCVVVQGTKWTTFGDRRYDYPAGRALVPPGSRSAGRQKSSTWCLARRHTARAS